jgi:two-component system, cell cycle sensor histidine kinase and response regulator CckA
MVDGKYLKLAGRQPREYDFDRPRPPAATDREGRIVSVNPVEAAVVQLREQDEQLRHAQKLESIGALAGGVAHEFNNLLQAILGYTRFAMETIPPTEQSYQDLEQVVKVAERAAMLTRQLLGFGRREVLDRTQVDPNHMVADLVEMLRPLIGEHIELRLELGEDIGSVNADSGLLQQMLLNLCVNARDAMPDGGELTVSTRAVVFDAAYCEIHPDAKPGNYLLLTVTDTGHGMPREVQERIFEPFFTTKEVGKGSGLGLAMVYGVVQQHGGTIHVYSELGLGTTFRLYLPLAEQSAIDLPPATEAAANLAASTMERKTILIAEDDASVRELMVRVLNRAGYSTLTACNGEEAIRVFEANSDRISLALLDVVMPKMSGRAVYQGIKMLNPDAKVVFCSGYDPETSCNGFVAKEGLRLIQKPFHPDSLLRTVREVLNTEPLCAAS